MAKDETWSKDQNVTMPETVEQSPSQETKSSDHSATKKPAENEESFQFRDWASI